MDQKALRVLEYNRILEMLSAQCSSGMAREEVSGLLPSCDAAAVCFALDQTEEAVTVLLKKGAGEAGHSDALYFYLLLYGDFAGAKTVVSDDKTARDIVAYVIASYFKLAIENASSEQALEELRQKYGSLREFRDAMSNARKSTNP